MMAFYGRKRIRGLRREIRGLYGSSITDTLQQAFKAAGDAVDVFYGFERKLQGKRGLSDRVALAAMEIRKARMAASKATSAIQKAIDAESR
jgi:hypothetical protein